MIEKRYAALRDAAGPLTGTLIPYGSPARIGRVVETIRPGAFGDISGADVVLTLEHTKTNPLLRTGAGLSLTDSTDALLAKMDGAEDNLPWIEARSLVKAGVLRGLSAEFVVGTGGDTLSPHPDGGVHRIIHRAKLVGASLVAKPAYPAAEVRSLEIAIARRTKRRDWWVGLI